MIHTVYISYSSGLDIKHILLSFCCWCNELFVSTEFVINPNGKSEVCILHEYMQRILKVRPVYNFFDCGKFLFLKRPKVIQ